MMTAQKKILFVEPQAAQQKIYETALEPEKQDWLLLFASNAEEAFQFINNSSIDIIVTGYHLPDQSGICLLEEIQEIHPEIIRFLLIDTSEKHEFRSLVNAAHQIILKPLETKTLTSTINKALMLRSKINDPEILRILGNINALPSLPRVFQKLSTILRRSTVSLHEVANLITQDIVLSAKVLKLAHSELFNLHQPTQDIASIVPLLGNSAVSSLVFSQTIFNTFDDNAFSESIFEMINRHSCKYSSFASHLLSDRNAKQEIIEQSIFCGIVHDLGNLVLARYAPEKWKHLQVESEKGEKTEVELEKEIMGITHSDIIAYLLAIWGFSDEQIAALAFHHTPSKTTESEFGLLGALHIAEYCYTDDAQKCDIDMDYLELHQISLEDIESFKSNFKGAA